MCNLSGFSNHCADLNGRTAAARGFFGLVSEQSIYNLMTREIELEVHARHDVYVVTEPRGIARITACMAVNNCWRCVRSLLRATAARYKS